MSLNGLDDVKIKEAHDAAIAELGGWFLLKYISRDEVELLERGNGGIVEIRNAIAQCPDDSPLFGFLRYRRRNVLIKYLPTSCSRLVQARVAVHFNAVTEKFSPYDTSFPIISSKELKDSTLSSACSLHTASGSTSSSTSSLRKRRLMEITEDENEDKRQSIEPEERPATAKTSSVAGSQPLSATREDLKASEGYASTASDATSLNPPGATNSTSRSLAKSLDGRRQSSSSSRPDIYSYNSFGSNGRPKVKLGPRPSLDTGGRPQTSASFGSYRPVSTLPPGMRLLSKNSRGAKETSQMEHPNPPPIMTISPPASGSDPSATQTTTLVRPHTSGGRPGTSSASSMKSPLSAGMTTPKVPVMTPEKMRLMKALQLRQKKLSAAAPPQPVPSPDVKLDTSPIPEIRFSEDSIAENKDVSTTANEMSRADSGISIEATPAAKVAASETTTMSSSPNSPTAPSEAAASTQASSISDSTDETIREADDGETVVKVADESRSVEASQVHEEQDNRTQEHGNGLFDAENLHSTEEHSEQSKHSDVELKQSKEVELQMIPEFGVLEDSSLPGTDIEGDHSPETQKPHDPAPTSDGPEEIPNASEHTPQQVPSENTIISNYPSLTKDGSVSPNALQEDVLSSPVTQKSVESAQVASPPRELRIPRSKFSSRNLRSTHNTGSVFETPTPTGGQELPSSTPKSPAESIFSEDTKQSITEEGQDVGSPAQSKEKRRGLVEPIRTDVDKSGHDSEADFLSDDDLMDELQSATVQEAKPIHVSKSPNSPAVSAPASHPSNEGGRSSRAFSNPFQKDGTKGNLLSVQGKQTDSPRSVSASAAYFSRINQQQSLPVIKKVNLGSGISQRIKALEKLSSSTTTPSPPGGATGATPVASSTFFSVKKSSSRAGSMSPSIAERGASLTNNTSPTSSRESSPEAVKLRDRSGSIQSRRDAFKSSLAAQPPRSRPESISVTARIIRDPNQPFSLKPDTGKDALELSPLDLKNSPLVIDHQKAIVASTSPKKEKRHDRKLSSSSKEIRKERRSSISMVRDLISDRRSSFAERRKSVTIEPRTRSPHRSSSRPPSTHTNSSSNVARPASISSRRSSSSHNMSMNAFPLISSTPTSPIDEVDKKSGRTSRMLRKMSASLSASRKSFANVISPTVREEFEPPSNQLQSISSPGLASSAANLGDVNIQFPDNLLWKRRFMSLDSHGYLILAQAQGSKSTDKSASIKKYHLSEFRMPFVPEMEAQELPNSVVLDFIDGGGLQVACEDRGGQLRVLEVLLESHRSYSAFGQ